MQFEDKYTIKLKTDIIINTRNGKSKNYNFSLRLITLFSLIIGILSSHLYTKSISFIKRRHTNVVGLDLNHENENHESNEVFHRHYILLGTVAPKLIYIFYVKYKL